MGGIGCENQILWIGAIAWLKDDRTYFPEVTYPGIVSGSAFQQAIIEGLEQQGQRIRILSDGDMSTTDRVEWSHNGISEDVRVAGNGNRFLRIPKKIKELLIEIKKPCYLDGIDIVCAYEMHLPYLLCLHRIKRKKANIKTVLVCPDLSIYMDLDFTRKPIKRILKKVEYFVSRYLLKCVDGYVLFTEHMKEYFINYGKPYVVVEGVYCDKYSLKSTEKRPFIMHAGSLHYNTGIEELISAFERIDENELELWFFGSGAMDGYIQNVCRGNNKVKHMGFVSPDELFEYEKQATLLVNVRNPKETYTKYSFPSKTFEYMASGTPLLSTDLQGIPENYKEHLLLIKNNSVQAISEGLRKALAMSCEERKMFGESARKFVMEQKNKVIQSSKILKFFSEL